MSDRSTREAGEERISALLDGELSGDAALEAVDLLVSSASACRFYREARALQGLVALLPEVHRPEPAGGWPAVVARAGAKGRARRLAWPLQLAASVALLAGLAYAAASGVPGRSASGSAPESVRVGSRPAVMDEERFGEMAVELLGAEERYRRDMLRLLREVDRRAGALEAAPEPGGERTEAGGEEESASRRRV